ncbi:circadian clock KaiB family protein [Mucilaginibacter antarcticus]|uniref:Circadian clock KaiB family protein n=1 Tax=Mucilaginibacter antarcticus TaxID=1855725 RepID=A0ABW5XRK1_9SPHI
MSAENNTLPDWAENDESFYALRLFVAGSSSASVRAIENLNEILEQYLAGKYDLEIIDVHQQPELVRDENVSAVPLLIKKLPVPRRLLVGDMSDKQRVLKGLGLTDI